MINGIDPTRPSESLGRQFQTFNDQSAVAVNMIVSVLAVFGISYYIGHGWGVRKEKCLVFGLVAGSIVLIMEMILYIVRGVQLEESSTGSQKRTSVLVTTSNVRDKSKSD